MVISVAVGFLHLHFRRHQPEPFPLVFTAVAAIPIPITIPIAIITVPIAVPVAVAVHITQHVCREESARGPDGIDDNPHPLDPVHFDLVEGLFKEFPVGIAVADHEDRGVDLVGNLEQVGHIAYGRRVYDDHVVDLL